VNGNPVKTGDELVEAITRAPLGSKVEITYVRDRKERNARVIIEAREQVFSGNASTAGSSPSEESSSLKFGLNVEVNQKGVESSGDLRRELAGLQAGGEVVFKVLRRDQDRGLLASARASRRGAHPRAYAQRDGAARPVHPLRIVATPRRG